MKQRGCCGLEVKKAELENRQAGGRTSVSIRSLLGGTCLPEHSGK